MAQIQLTLKPTSLQCPTLVKLNLTINSPLKEGFTSNHSLCLATCPLMLKRQLKRGKGKKSVCYLVCQTVCVFYIDTTLSAQPNMLALPNLTWPSVKQAGTMAYDCVFCFVT